MPTSSATSPSEKNRSGKAAMGGSRMSAIEKCDNQIGYYSQVQSRELTAISRAAHEINAH